MRASRAMLDDGCWMLDYLVEFEHSTFNIQHPKFNIIIAGGTPTVL